MDQRLRDLERAAADGDGDARLRLLAERVRAGVITPRHLRVAAWLGDPIAARLRASDALFRGADEPDPPPAVTRLGVDPVTEEAGLLATLGAEPLARAALAVAEAALPEWLTRFSTDGRPAGAIAAARRQAGTTPAPGSWDPAGLEAIEAADDVFGRDDDALPARATALVAAAAAVLRAQPREGARLLVEALDVDREGPVGRALRAALLALACGDPAPRRRA